MKNHGQYEIWLTGSRTKINRTVKEDNETNKTYIRFYGKDIEVIRSPSGMYITKEAY